MVSRRRAGEVILAAGAPLSPVLLLRSGIGPIEDLRAIGITSQQDLPGVGRNLYDQPGAVIPAIPQPGSVPSGAPMTEVIGRLDSFPGHVPDQAFYLTLFTGPAPGGTDPMIALMVGDFAPVSRGTISLAGPATGQRPIIDLGFYTAAGDLTRMRDAYRYAWTVATIPLAGSPHRRVPDAQ